MVVMLLFLMVDMSFVAFGRLVLVIGVLVALGEDGACAHGKEQSCGKQLLHGMNPITRKGTKLAQNPRTTPEGHSGGRN